MTDGVEVGWLEALYAHTDDPWNFRTSAYERAKFAATEAALPRSRYTAGLELGCGNGELARRLAPRCAHYLGVDAVETALGAARTAAPQARFELRVLPDELPEGAYDLIVLSEILYFFGPSDIAVLADQIDRRWPGADLLCVTWLGPSGNPLEGEAAFGGFRTASRRAFELERRAPLYRIDVAGPLQ